MTWANLESVADRQVLYLTTVVRRTGLPRLGDLAAPALFGDEDGLVERVGRCHVPLRSKALRLGRSS
jgi:hypothetical protein